MKSAKLAIGIDLGASNLRIGVVSEEGKILGSLKELTDKSGKDGASITRQMVKMIKAIKEKNKIQKKISGIGIASIGPLNYKRGGAENSPNVPYDFIPLIKPIEREFKTPVYLHNDANASALAERYFGAGKKIQNLIYITISTGIGGGAIVNDHLLLGKSGNAAEIGHIIVDTKYNIPCTCGHGIGHWEGLASGLNIPKFFEIWRKFNNTEGPSTRTATEARVIFAQAKTQNQFSLNFLEELSRINARAVSTIIAAYDPELITIGGAVALHNPGFIIGGIKKYMDDFLKVPDIKITHLGDKIGLLGAAASVFQKINPSLLMKK